MLRPDQPADIQLPLPFELNEDRLKEFLSKKAGVPLHTTVTDNSTRMLSVRTRGGVFYLRLHRIFLHAPEEVLREVASFIRKRGMKTPAIKCFIRQESVSIRKPKRKKAEGSARGRFHDLSDAYESVNNECFDNGVKASIIWGQKTFLRRTVRMRTLGSYDFGSDTVRINPLLDSPRVPAYFIRYVVYHEMLHASIGVKRTGATGRRAVHTKEFRLRERQFTDYGKAVKWEKENVGFLVRRKERG